MGLSNDLSCEAGSLSCCRPQPQRVFSLRGLRLYLPALEVWVPWSALLPAVCPVYLCANVGPQGLLVVRLPAPFVPHSASLGPATSRSPLCLGCLSPPFLPVWMYVSFLSTCCNSLLFDFLPVLVVRGGTVCLPMPPSWFFRRIFCFLNRLKSISQNIASGWQNFGPLHFCDCFWASQTAAI